MTNNNKPVKEHLSAKGGEVAPKIFLFQRESARREEHEKNRTRMKRIRRIIADFDQADGCSGKSKKGN